MAAGADVRSIDVLREWLAALANYHADANEALSGIRMEIHRGEEWVQAQLSQWQRAVREREDDVTKAKQALSAKKGMPDATGRDPDTSYEQKILRKAQARLEHAHDQVKTCRSWIANLDKLIDEAFTGAGHKLQTFLDGDLARGEAALGRQLEALEKYASLRTEYGTLVGGGSTAPAPPKVAPAAPPPPNS